MGFVAGSRQICLMGGVLRMPAFAKHSAEGITTIMRVLNLSSDFRLDLELD